MFSFCKLALKVTTLQFLAYNKKLNAQKGVEVEERKKKTIHLSFFVFYTFYFLFFGSWYMNTYGGFAMHFTHFE